MDWIGLDWCNLFPVVVHSRRRLSDLCRFVTLGLLKDLFCVMHFSRDFWWIKILRTKILCFAVLHVWPLFVGEYIKGIQGVLCLYPSAKRNKIEGLVVLEVVWTWESETLISIGLNLISGIMSLTWFNLLRIIIWFGNKNGINLSCGE